MAVYSPSQLFSQLKQQQRTLITCPDQLDSLMEAIEDLADSDVLGVDTETLGLDPRTDRVRLLQIASHTHTLVIDLDGFRDGVELEVDWWDDSSLADVRKLLQSNRLKVLHNASFDINMLRGSGLDVTGPFFDTMIASKIINNGMGAKNDLKSVVNRQLQLQMSKEEQTSDWGGDLSEEQLNYAAFDAAVLPHLYDRLEHKLKEAVRDGKQTNLKVFELEMKCLKPIALMQWNGFGFDKEAAKQFKAELGERLEAKLQSFLMALDDAIKTKHPDDRSVWLPRDPDGSFNTRTRESGSIKKGTKLYPGFNPRSPKQMAERFKQAGIILPPDDKGVPSLDQNLLAFIRSRYPLVDQYMDWKGQATLNSHVEKLLKSIGPDGRIHGSYKQLGAQTGRLSAAEPNLQQVPRSAEFRSLFVAAEGYKLVLADFSQIELRVAAELSGEERMIQAYMEDKDLHLITASSITGKPLEEVTKAERTSAKICNFGLIYGAGPATLKKQAIAQYGVDMSLQEAKKYVNGFRSAYPQLKKWQDKEGNSTTRAVFTKMGRMRILTGFDDKYTTRVNTQVQGTAGDIAKTAIALLWLTHGLGKTPASEAKLIAMVHDEIVMEVREDLADEWAKKLSQAMEQAGALHCSTVPIKAEASTGANWAEAK